jgi:hypothetical protein
MYASSICPAQGCTNEAIGLGNGDQLGWAMANIGDVDGDGAQDVAIGAPEASNPLTGGGVNGNGYVQVRSGRTGALLGTVTGTQLGELFGYRIVSLADVNGDGRPDSPGASNFLVAAPWFDGTAAQQGRVYLVSGTTLSILAAIDNPAPVLNARFGFGLTGVGNITGDGRSEFVVSAPSWGIVGSSARGRVSLFGWGAGPTAIELGDIRGTTTGSNLGYQVRGVGDATGDGIADLLVQEDGTQTVRLLSLGAFTGPALATISAPAGYSGNTYGWSLCGLGDLNGDGQNEFAIGVPDCPSGGCNSNGFVEIRSATATGTTLHKTVRASAEQETASIRFGTTLASVGDINGDLVPDLAIGAPTADPVGTSSGGDDAGAVYVFAGSSLLPAGPARQLVVLDGTPGEQAGQAIAGLGDTNLDQQLDVAIGSPEAFVGGSGRGRATIVRHLQKSRLYGSDCAPVGNTAPELHVAMAGGPCVGQSFAMHLTQLPPNSLCVLGLGLGSANVPGFLQPQCTLLIQPGTTFGIVTGVQTFARFAVHPVTPSLVGASTFWQWVVLGTNFPLTVEMSQGLNVTF